MFPGAYQVDVSVPTEEEPSYIPFMSFIEFMFLALVASMHPTLPFLLIGVLAFIVAMIYFVNGASLFTFATASLDVVLGSSLVSSLYNGSLSVRSLFNTTPLMPSVHIPAERTAATATSSPDSKILIARARPHSFIAPRSDTFLNYDKFKRRPVSFHGASSTPLFASDSPCDTPTKGLRPLILVQKMEQGLISTSESNLKSAKGCSLTTDLQHAIVLGGLLLCKLTFYKIISFTAALSLTIMRTPEQEDLFSDVTDNLEPHSPISGSFKLTPAPSLLNHITPIPSSFDPASLIKSEDKTNNDFDDSDDDSDDDDIPPLRWYVDPEEKIEPEDPEDAKDIAFFLNSTTCLSYDTALPTPPTSPESEAPSTPSACAKTTSGDHDCSRKWHKLSLRSRVHFSRDLSESGICRQAPSLPTITEEDENEDPDLNPRRSQPAKRALASRSSISPSCDYDIAYPKSLDAFPTPLTSPKGDDTFYDNSFGNFDPFAA